MICLAVKQARVQAPETRSDSGWTRAPESDGAMGPRTPPRAPTSDPPALLVYSHSWSSAGGAMRGTSELRFWDRFGRECVAVWWWQAADVGPDYERISGLSSESAVDDLLDHGPATSPQVRELVGDGFDVPWGEQRGGRERLQRAIRAGRLVLFRRRPSVFVLPAVEVPAPPPTPAPPPVDDTPVETRVMMAVVPRRRDRIFTASPFASTTADTAVPADRIRDRLPHWRRRDAASLSLDEQRRIRAIEHRLHLDLATQVGGRWLAQRKLSVVCLYQRPDGKWRPVAGVPVTITREPQESALQLKLGNGTFGNALTGGDRPTTDAQGLAELAVAHPAAEVADAQKAVRIRAQAEVPKLDKDGNATSEKLQVTAELELRLVRNGDVTQVEEIFSEPDDPDSADRIWVFQPTAPSPRNEGIRRLQEALNEVVPRHRAIAVASGGLLTRDGAFGEPTRLFLASYLTNFRNVHAGNEYPYELKDIGPDPDLLAWVKEEYEPFDPTTQPNQGKIVDRRLLIGVVRDDHPAAIDGLWELYEGVVRVLQDEMRAFGQSYLDSDTFWLHRPIHTPYAAAQDQVFACRAAGVHLRTAPNASAPLLQQGNAPVALSDGDHLLVVTTAAGWCQVRHPAGLGWVQPSPATGQVFHNDAGRYRVPDGAGTQARNCGLHGNQAGGTDYTQAHTRNGVAYTYGGKQTPEQWRTSLTGNPHAPPQRIVHYDQYENGHRFGETQAELNAGDTGHMQAGCDCSGFVQNCIIHSFFPGTQIRIVPRALLGPLPASPVAAVSFVPGGGAGPARRIDPIATDADRHWIRGGDVFCTPGHVVMVAEDTPTLSNNGFKIMHEWGGTSQTDVANFRRKSVRSPFSWWGIGLGAGRFGKVFLWR